MAKKNDNTLLILGGLGIAAYLFLKPKNNTPVLNTYHSSAPVASNSTNLTSIVTNGAQALTNLLNIFKGGNSTTEITAPYLEARGIDDIEITDDNSSAYDPFVADLFNNNPYMIVSGIKRA